MKTRSTLKKVCGDCFFVKRKGTLYVRCTTTSKHKQRQGFMTSEDGAVENGHICAPTQNATTHQHQSGFQAFNQSLFTPAASTQNVNRPQLFFGMMTGFRNFGGNKPF